MDNEVIIREEKNQKDFLEILSEYQSKKLKKTVKVEARTEVVTVKGLKQIELTLVYSEYYGGEIVPVFLDEEDVTDALKDFANKKGLEFDRCQYVGNIQNAGYFINEDTPVFEGAYIYFKNKSLIKTLKKEILHH